MLFAKIYVGRDSILPQSRLNDNILKLWDEILLDETETKAVMIFRKNKRGEISVETILRDKNHIRSYVSDDFITEDQMWDIVHEACHRCTVYMTINCRKYNQYIESCECDCN